MWHFTFGQNSPLRNHFVSVDTEDYAEAREAIYSCFKDRWAFQYDDADIQDICDKFNSSRIFIIDKQPFNGLWRVRNDKQI